MFYTRIPCPRWVGYSEDQLNRSTRHFPAMGWIVGAVLVAILALAGLALPPILAVVLALAVGVLVTGAFHEDGFADLCDGFGGGTSPERTLDIMKDSRVGAFAAIGLVLLFSLKIATLTVLVESGLVQAAAAILFSQVLSRWCVVTIIFRDTYARRDLTSKIKPIGRSLSGRGLVAATLWLVPFVGLAWWRPWWGLAVPIAWLVRLALAAWFRRRLGGYTGDCLGAAQQIIEQVVLLVLVGCSVQAV
jgi:adenosylcobinamide-GDP ribazoletransferase